MGPTWITTLAQDGSQPAAAPADLGLMSQAAGPIPFTMTWNQGSLVWCGVNGT